MAGTNSPYVASRTHASPLVEQAARVSMVRTRTHTQSGMDAGAHTHLEPAKPLRLQLFDKLTDAVIAQPALLPPRQALVLAQPPTLMTEGIDGFLVLARASRPPRPASLGSQVRSGYGHCRW